MPSFTHTHNGNSIEIFGSMWSGRETVTYNGRGVSDMRSFSLNSRHSFAVEEEGETVQYEAALRTTLIPGAIHCDVRRNGIPVGSGRYSLGGSWREWLLDIVILVGLLFTAGLVLRRILGENPSLPWEGVMIVAVLAWRQYRRHREVVSLLPG
jgi:hypothetical protein